MNKWGNIYIAGLTRMCIIMYGDTEIETVKDLLFVFLHDQNAVTGFKKRRHANKNAQDKKTWNLENIFKLLEEKGEADILDFVALDLSNLPPITYNSIDVSVLLRKIDTLVFTFKSVKDGMSILTDAYMDICHTNTELNKRVGELEFNCVNAHDNTFDCSF